MSPTPTRTATASATETVTFTQTQTPSATPTDTATRTATATITTTHTDTPTPLPSPVDLDIRIETSGEEPKRGAKITYAIIIENNGYASVSNIKVWDELPPQVKLAYNNFSLEPVQTGSTLTWDVSYDHLGNPVVLQPGGMIRIEFVIEILDPTPDMLPLINRAFTDYNDPYYIEPNRHPPVASEVSFYPIERPLVFPNPFSLSANTTVKFSNIVPGSHIQIFTISGEGVISWFANSIRQHWDGKNRYGQEVSPGIYYFEIGRAHV